MKENSDIEDESSKENEVKRPKQRKSNKRKAADEEKVKERQDKPKRTAALKAKFLSDDESENSQPAKKRKGDQDGEQSPKKSRISRKTTSSTILEEFNEVDDEEDFTPNGSKKEYEAGQISKVEVENFMCHRHFTIQFNRRLNFVTGKNGSVVAAIQLCLGASARTTGRGTNLSNLIREGYEGPAIVRVTLYNDGADAYQPEKYGNRITVERKISKGSGASTYGLLNVKGDVVTREKKELDQMLRDFNIFVDNPCCVLTQEESKKFIQGHDHDKYEFFLKATGLHRTKDELLEIKAKLKVCQAEQAKHGGVLQRLKEDRDDKQKTLNTLMSLDVLEDKIKFCQAKTHWLQVQMAEGVLHHVEAGAEKVLAKVTEREEELKEAESVESDDTNRVEEVSAQFKVCKQDLDQIAEELRLKQSALLPAENKRKKLDLLIREEQGVISQLKDQLRTNKRQLDELKKRALEHASSSEKPIQDRIAAAERTIEQCTQKLRTLRQERDGAVNSCEVAEAELRTAENAVVNERKEFGRLRSEYQNMERSGGEGQRLSMFGAKVPEILEAMRRASFRGRVVGPLGMHVKYREGSEKEWGPAVERCIGPLAFAFVVSNGDDMRAMLSLLQSVKAGFHSVILQPSHSRYEVQHPPVPTVAQVLNIEDDLIFNCLVDQRSIERVGLSASERDCMRELVVRDNYGNDCLAHRLISVVTKDATQIRYANGNQSSEQSRHEYRGFFASDTSTFINNKRRELESYEARLSESQREVQAKAAACNDAKREREQVDSSIRRTQEKINGAEKALKSAKGELQEMEADNTQEELRECEVREKELELELEKTQRKIADLQTELHSTKFEVDERTKERREVEKRKCALEETLADYEKVLQKVVATREEHKRRIQAIRRKLEDVRGDYEVEESKVAQATEKYETKLQAARDNSAKLVRDWDGQPIKIDMSKEDERSIARQETEFRSELNEGKRQAGLQGHTVESVTHMLEAAHAKYEKSKEDATLLAINTTNLDKDYVDRGKTWSRSLKYYVKLTKEKFDQYAQAKGSSGTVTFDHSAQTLQLTYQVDNSDANTMSKDVRQLSGGERSYVTFSLLLALGHVVETPFRLMDEYDVFLDELTRKMTLNKLQEYVNEAGQRSRQYMVITPHKLTDVPTKQGEVKIIQVQDPARATSHGLQQQVLPF